MSLFAALLLWCVPAHALRLVTTSPQTTELVYQLGLGDAVVGVGAGSQYPAEAAGKPSIGQLFAPSLEKTLALAPDWVVLDTHTLNLPYAESLAALSLPTFLWNTQSPDALIQGAREFLKTVGRAPSTPLLDKLETCLAELPRPDQPRTFLLFVWLDPPILAGPGSFLTALLKQAGFVPGLALGKSAYLPVSEEWLVQRPVDEVFYLEHAVQPRAPTLARFAHWWPGIPSRFTALNADRFARASFMPLLHLNQLPLKALPKACHAF